MLARVLHQRPVAQEEARLLGLAHEFEFVFDLRFELGRDAAVVFARGGEADLGKEVVGAASIGSCVVGEAVG